MDQDCPQCGRFMLWKYLNEPRCGICNPIPKIAVMPTPAMIKAGNDMAAKLYDASVEYCLGNLHEYGDVRDQYVRCEIDSVTAIYIAMENAK